MIVVDNTPVKIDIAEWMRQTSRFDKIKATGREWIETTCPFHDDSHPSFAVNCETGAYRCQACGAHGDFVRLVKHVERHDTMLDAEQSLLSRFGRFVPAVDEELTLDFGDRKEETFVNAEVFRMMIKSCSTWLYAHRRISGDVQRRFWIGETMDGSSVVIPWFDDRGRCVTVKHRSTVDKRFWYDPPIAAGRLKRLLYGFHLAKDADMIVVCEGEIDAMSVVQAGFAAVALGGAHMSEAQANLLRNAKADEIVVFTDNDAAGRKARQQIVDALIGHKRVSVVDWTVLDSPERFKDANDVLRLSKTTLGVMIENRVPVPLPLKFD